MCLIDWRCQYNSFVSPIGLSNSVKQSDLSLCQEALCQTGKVIFYLDDFWVVESDNDDCGRHLCSGNMCSAGYYAVIELGSQK